MRPNIAQELAIYGMPYQEEQEELRVVIAGPGSGKTFTLTECVKHHAATEIIAVMTFTNAAACEMRKRLGDVAERLAFIGTTHSYCFRLIQWYGDLIGYKSGRVAILPEAERLPRLLAVRDKLGLKMVTQEKLLARHETAELIWKEYEFLLKRNNLVDYDGILREGAILLSRFHDDMVKYDWLFVDERQDSSAEDQLVYNRIPAARKFYVGDPDQSIFAFRGGDPGGFVQLAETEGADVIKLQSNYRSDISICEAANKLIAQNRMRVNKVIVPVSLEAGKVKVQQFSDEWQELAWIECTTRGCRIGGHSIAVLCRRNYEVDRCYKFLFTQGIPVKRQRWVEHPPDWERALLLLSLAASPDNEILAERYLKLDNPPIIVDQWLLESRAGGYEFTKRTPVIGFHHSRAVSDRPVLKGTARFLAENGVGEPTINLIKQRSELLPPDATLPDLLQDLYSHEDMQQEETGEGIHVGTMHSAKGQEFDVVFLPAFEENVIPHGHGQVQELIEEERRLAFVAVTRAKHELYISWAEKRQFQWGGVQDMQPSRFIAELGLAP